LKKKQMDKVTNKAYRAFWMCRDTVGKTWGLKPKVMYWIYTVVVRPIVTFATTLWVQFKTRKVELSKLQRMACLDVIGAMKTAPTAATEVVIGLLPLHLHLEAEARAGIYSLCCSDQWKPKSEGLDMHI
jgi:hypothetical protein